MTSKPRTAAELGIGQDPDLPPEKRATSGNWTIAPYSRWSFQRVQQFTRTVRVARADNPSPLQNKAADMGAISFANGAGSSETIADMLTRTYTDGVIALRGNDIVYEQYFNGMDATTLHLIMSCSKAVTSAVAGNAIHSGQLNPEALVTEYLPELAGSGFTDATVQHCLDMRVGVEFNEDYDDLDADWARYEVATGWREDRNYDGPYDQIDFSRELGPADRPHGGPFHYQSVLTCILGCCLERATGEPFADLLEKQVWQPMGAEQDFVSIIDSAGTVSFEGGFNMCLRDFARFGLLIARDGCIDGKQLIASDWLQECRRITPELTTALLDADYDESVREIFTVRRDEGVAVGAYHNQWWLRPEENTLMMVTGVGGQFLVIDPARDFVAAAVSSHPDYVNSEVWMDRLNAFNTIADAVC